MSGVDGGRRPVEEQIRAVLSGDVWHWALPQLPPGLSIDDLRFRDFIAITEDDILAHVAAHGFGDGIVVEGGDANECHCLVPDGQGRWAVYYSERGARSRETVVDDLDAARREVVHRLMDSARISLNHRYRLAHPELNLPRPSEMD